MELIPALEPGWLNGWILICLLYLTYSILLIVFPKDVVKRLYDKSGRSKRQEGILYIGSFFAFVYFGLIIFSPLKIGSPVFIPGIILFVLGLLGFVAALFNFKSASPDQPITSGLYRISRNPQQVMFYVCFIGVCIAIGSWLALFVQIISAVFLHARILAEEKACIKQYGDSYLGYMERVPRYFLFF